MKRIITIGMAILICLSLSLGAFAQMDEEHPPRLVDTADLLSATEETILMEQLDEISLRQKTDVVIVTVSHLEEYDPEDFAKDYYKRHNYGQGLRNNGVLLLISEESGLYTKGFGTKAVNKNGEEYLMEQLDPSLQAKEYAKAFSLFATETDSLLEMARQGRPYKPPFSSWLYWMMGLGAAVAVYFGVAAFLHFRKK